MAASRLSNFCILPAKRYFSAFPLVVSGRRLLHSFIPPFVEKKDEPIQVKRNRLQYQSRKRGMLENCILLSTFAEKHLARLDEEQMSMYDRLINLPSNDWDIYYWATGKLETPAEFDNVVMDLLKVHAKNPDKELRATQPPLLQPQ